MMDASGLRTTAQRQTQVRNIKKRHDTFYFDITPLRLVPHNSGNAFTISFPLLQKHGMAWRPTVLGTGKSSIL